MLYPSKITGFIPDAFRIMAKYKLTSYVKTFMETGHFPKTDAWRRIVNTSIRLCVESEFQNNKNDDKRLCQFKLIHNGYKLCNLWYFSSIYRDQLPNSRSAMRVLCRFFSRQFPSVCQKCNLKTDELILHKTMFCTRSSLQQQKLWTELYKCIGADSYDSFLMLTPEKQLIEMLSGLAGFAMEDRIRGKTFKTTIPGSI